MTTRFHHRPPSPRRRRAAVVVVWGALVALASGCGSLSRDDNARGVALYQQGNYRGAVGHFQRALSRQPGSPDCFYNLGAAHHQRARSAGQADDLRLAEQYYHLCLARSPDHAACQKALAVLLVEERRSPEGVAILEAWALRRPADPEPRLELARISQHHGDLDGAERHLAAALAIDPANHEALAAIGRIRQPGAAAVASATGPTPGR